MRPEQFIVKWKKADLSEHSAYQQHFLDLCDLLSQQKPADADPAGEWYTFEKGVDKTDGGRGFADVWKQGYFGWECKGKHKDIKAAYQQLLKYREALNNPPPRICVLVVLGTAVPTCDALALWRHAVRRGTPLHGAPSNRRRPRILHVPRRLGRRLRPEQPGDDVERHVDPGRDAGRGDDAAVVDEADALADGCPRHGFAEEVERAVVRRDRQAVEQAGGGEDQRAGADRQHQLGLGGAAANPIHDCAVVHFLARALAAGDEQDLRRRAVLQSVIGVYAQAISRANGAGVLGDEADPERPRVSVTAGNRKHLERPAEIEHFGVVEHEDRDRSLRCHGRTLYSVAPQTTGGAGVSPDLR